MLDAAFQGLSMTLQPGVMLYVVFGVVLGLVFGVIPGLNGPIALALFTPLTYKMDPASAMAFLLASYGAVSYGGSVSAILIGVPGTGENVATCFDGYEMTKKGEAGRALAASATASGLGAIVGVVVLIALLPVLRQIVLSFGPSEVLMISLWGLTALAVLGGSIQRGLISGGLGLLLATVGFEPVSGTLRYGFGLLYLYDGINLTAALIGLFAVTESISLLVKGGTIQGPEIKTMGSVLQGIKDVFHHRYLFMRCSIIGLIVGIMPGVGGAVGNIIAYSHALQTTKGDYGKGDVRGVIAPESSVNSKEGGDLIPTIAFGVPGAASMAILLNAFYLHGLNPGKELLTTKLSYTFLMAFTLLAGNILSSLFGVSFARLFSKIALIRTSILAPVILVFAFLGSYGVNGRIGDVAVAFIFGIVGLLLKKYDYSRAAVVIGLVLGEIIERSYHLSVQTFGWSFLLRPLTLTLLAFTIVTLLVPIIWGKEKEEDK
jgi:putative tricarboxylic transport membrane protein